MTDKSYKNYVELRRPRTRAIRALNDVHVTRHLTFTALAKLTKRLHSSEPEEINFSIPSVSGETIVVTRDKSAILKLVEQTQRFGLYAQSLIAAIAITEGYFFQIASMTLRWHPEKLKAGGTGAEDSISLDDLLASTGIEDLLSKLANKRLMSIFYQSPEKYFQQLEKLLSVELEEKLKDKYIEAKATRDILVHNEGIANDLYLKRAKKNARAARGEVIPLDKKYFEQTVRCMKSLVRSIYSQTLKKYGNAQISSR